MLSLNQNSINHIQLPSEQSRQIYNGDLDQEFINGESILETEIDKVKSSHSSVDSLLGRDAKTADEMKLKL